MIKFEVLIFDSSTFKAISLPPKCQIVKPWLTEQSITLIAGERGSGKTWFALSLLDSITRGIPFGPWTTLTPVPCLYLDGELPPQDIQDRLKSINQSEDRKCKLLIYNNAVVVAYGAEKANLNDPEWQTRMQRFLVEKNIRLWVVDNLSALTPGIDENSKKDFDPINQFFLQLRFAGIATIVLHHTGKKGLQRGTSAREDVIDTSIILKKPSDYSAKQGARFILSFTKSRVATRDGNLLADVLFHLQETTDGHTIWEFEHMRTESKSEILQMLNNGVKNRDIANILNVSASYVSKIKKQAIKDGILTDGCKLTEKGISLFESG